MIVERLKTLVIEKGGDETLLNTLLRFGDKPFLTWAVRDLCSPSKDVTIESTLETFAIVSDISVGRIKYAYFSAQSRDLRYLKLETQYVRTRKELEDKFKDVDTTLWDILFPTTHETLRKIAVELALERGVDINDIPVEFGMSRSYAYEIRRVYLERITNGHEEVV